MAAGPVAPARTHEQDLASRAQDHTELMRRRQQSARFTIILLIVLVWLTQTAYVTYFAVHDPKILDDVEKFIGLIAVTGGVATVIIMKLWPENEGNGGR